MIAGGGARQITVVGEPGIGKSRLARELIARLAPPATGLVGRCPPYGEGVTFWPLRELLRQAERSEELLSGKSHEVFASVRRLLAELAGERPLIVVFDDVQWAEPTFLDLVEYLAGRLGQAPVLLLCSSPVPSSASCGRGGYSLRVGGATLARAALRRRIGGDARDARRGHGAGSPHRRRGRGKPALRGAARRFRRRGRRRRDRDAGLDPRRPPRAHRPARARAEALRARARPRSSGAAASRSRQSRASRPKGSSRRCNRICSPSCAGGFLRPDANGAGGGVSLPARPRARDRLRGNPEERPRPPARAGRGPA